MRNAVLGIAVFVAVIIIANTFFYVHEGEYAVVKRFEEVVDIRSNAGMAMKIPFVDSKMSLTKKYVMYDLEASEVLTKDKKSMIADTYAVWKIVEPRRFLQTAGNIRELERRLDATVYGSLKTTIGAIDQVDIIESRTNNSLNDMILGNAKATLENYGIELLDVQIKKFDLPASNKNAVFERMISERNQIAATYTAEGEEEANKIRYTADKEKEIIVSQARARSAELEAEGESEYMRILTGAYNSAERADFYEFLRTLDALKITMKGNKTLIISSESNLVKTLIGVDKRIEAETAAVPDTVPAAPAASTRAGEETEDGEDEG